MTTAALVYGIVFAFGVLAHLAGGRYLFKRTQTWHPLTRALAAGLFWLLLFVVATYTPIARKLGWAVHTSLNLYGKH